MASRDRRGRSICNVCDNDFVDNNALRQHRRDTGHTHGLVNRSDDDTKDNGNTRGNSENCRAGNRTRTTNRLRQVRQRKAAAKRRERERKLQEILASLPPPFDGLSGRWVTPEDFDGNKSFGKFVCSKRKCDGTWTSAHAYPDSGQQCSKCSSRAFERPWGMWQNDHNTYNNDAHARSDNKPHEMQLCERCLRGQRCTLALA
jgi:hypothetical protein